MPWGLFLFTLLLAIVTMFWTFSMGAFFTSAVGQVLGGVLSLICFALICYAFWQYGWKVGLAQIAIVFGGSNIGLSIYDRIRRHFDL